jgi:uncharacterized membrane-anchored protein YjiN (DUF445 family)
MNQVSETSKNTRFMSRVATTLLILTACVFFTCLFFLDTYPWLEIVIACSEAAMVGALADWFAVTALFRHPLGIPIPHTAIVPNNQSKIGKSLGLFIEQHFFSEEVLARNGLDIAGPLSRWLQIPQNKSFVVIRLRTFCRTIINLLDDEEVSRAVSEILLKECQKIDVARLAATTLELLKSEAAHELVLDELLKAGGELVVANESWLRQNIRDACPWFVPSFVDRKIFEAIAVKTETTIREALSDRSHELRKRLHMFTERLIERLRCDPDLRIACENVQKMVLENDVFLTYLKTIKNHAKEAFLTSLSDDNSSLSTTLYKGFDKVAKLIETDTHFREKVNQTLKTLVGVLVSNHRKDIGTIVARTINSWDIQTLVRRFEDQVGRDLQYIRVNGTIVGGVIGLALYYIKQIAG